MDSVIAKYEIIKNLGETAKRIKELKFEELFTPEIKIDEKKLFNENKKLQMTNYKKFIKENTGKNILEIENLSKSTSDIILKDFKEIKEKLIRNLDFFNLNLSFKKNGKSLNFINIGDKEFDDSVNKILGKDFSVEFKDITKDNDFKNFFTGVNLFFEGIVDSLIKLKEIVLKKLEEKLLDEDFNQNLKEFISISNTGSERFFFFEASYQDPEIDVKFEIPSVDSNLKYDLKFKNLVLGQGLDNTYDVICKKRIRMIRII